MATVNGYLEGRVRTYTPNQDTLAAARRRKEEILKRLYDDHIVHMFETGSLNHGTGIWGYSDVDYFVQFFGDKPTPTTALERIRSSMVARYPYTNIRVSRPAVKVDFTNGVKVELVPAYATGEVDVYWIPDPTDSAKWMKSAPKKHLQYVNEAQAQQANTKNVIRLMKLWKALRSVPVSSFYLEMRTAQYMKSQYSAVSTSAGVDAVFSALSQNRMSTMFDPTFSGGSFAPTSTLNYHSQAMTKLSNASTNLLTSAILNLSGNPDGAIEPLRKVFE